MLALLLLEDQLAVALEFELVLEAPLQDLVPDLVAVLPLVVEPAVQALHHALEGPLGCRDASMMLLAQAIARLAAAVLQSTRAPEEPHAVLAQTIGCH